MYPVAVDLISFRLVKSGLLFGYFLTSGISDVPLAHLLLSLLEQSAGKLGLSTSKTKL